ncbi:MAG: D-isomer specific 2-hydroxyacid dehydrogenase family protein [Clostridium sp.]
MKIAVYSCRPDEEAFFEEYGARYKIEVVKTQEAPNFENASLIDGCQAVSIISTPISADLVEDWYGRGIRVISTRTIGYEHVDYQRAAELGMIVSNVSYTAHTVAEYTVMTILMAIRKMKAIMMRYIGQDYSLSEIRGKELRNMTVGVIGTGRIGENVIKYLSGFSCRILAYDMYPKEHIRELAEYVELEKIWKECDIITVHAPATEETYHMFNSETIAKMKDGVILINMARGSMMDTEALISALESGKVGAAALDMVEGDNGIYYKDFKYTPTGHHGMAILNTMPNVLMTPHTAFFTDEAVSDMVEFSIKSCVDTLNGKENPWKIN